MDIGGGSTELIVGTAAGEMQHAVSLDIGSVRMTERFLKAGPPTPEAVAAATAYIDDLLDRSAVDFSRVRTWIGVAGTATTLAGVLPGLPRYDRARVHGSAAHLRPGRPAAGRRLQSMTVEEIRALPSMHPGRADVVTGGALIASGSRRTPAPGMLVSESDILDGIALELLALRRRPCRFPTYPGFCRLAHQVSRAHCEFSGYTQETAPGRPPLTGRMRGWTRWRSPWSGTTGPASSRGRPRCCRRTG